MPDRDVLKQRLWKWLRYGTLAGVFAVVFVAPLTVVVVHESSTPEFCHTCHIMDPYYDSWDHSAHGEIACIECHFEPGTMGTIQGKFQALSQLAKYVTRTQGTRPWAHVSDESCMRSGCHSTSELDGRIDFVGVAFDHTPHLLETRGKRLQCVSCHSQVTIENHFEVDPGTCAMCHFRPGPDGTIPERVGGCRVCHEPPAGAIEVAGRPFEHDAYLARGVDCRECHDSVVQGTGVVPEQRCRSCHGEPELLAQFGESELLHRVHVSERKVECLECHLEIRHGDRLARDPHAGADAACADCHQAKHSAASFLATGTGFSIPGLPSRMHDTQVACGACHTGRSGANADGDHAAAGEVDCLHCHGTAYAGMLAEWQGAVGGGLEELLAAATELEEHLGQSDGAGAHAALEAVQGDLALLARDGSRGAHNPTFAMDVLRAAAARIDEAWATTDPERGALMSAALPPPSEAACASCHLDVTLRDPGPSAGPTGGGFVERAPQDGGGFRHEPHLRGAGLTCSDCHVAEPHGSSDHGRLAFPRSQCAECHHTESATLDPYDCARCHGGAQAFFEGGLAGFESTPVHMQDKECTECHGEPPDILVPPGAMCVLCHEEGFDAMLAEWQGAVGGGLEALLAATNEVENRAAGEAGAWDDLNAIHRDLALLARDSARGAHNPALSLDLLRSAATRLDALAPTARALDLVPPPADPACAGCHLDVTSHDPLELEGGGTFRHGPHLRTAGVTCATCHVAEPLGEDGHGQPAFPRSECSQCHHTETETLDPYECATCHAAQQNFFEGLVADLADAPVHMPDKECTECHGEPPDILVPPEAMCVLCHDEEYGEMLTEWRATTQSLGEELEAALAAPAAGATPAALDRARRALDLVGADGSNGVHNFLLAERLLREALEGLK